MHLGASLWHRNNVIIGFYGMWHGSPTNSAHEVTMDIGLVLSHDALHYHEPIPDFPMINARSRDDKLTRSTSQRAPALAHGQGFSNRGDETLVWFSTWLTPSDGIRLATWQRDRLGFLQPWKGALSQPPCLISAPISTDGSRVEISVNAEGLTKSNRLRVSVLDEHFRELPGFSAAACTQPIRSGLRERVTWETHDSVVPNGRIRIRLDFEGPQVDDLKVYGIYVTSAR